MSKVSHILAAKGGEVWSIKPEKQVLDALILMAEKNVGALLVLKDNKVVGILSERDYARKVALHGKRSMSTSVSEIMTADVVSVHPKDSIRECMELMTANRIRHLPVMDRDLLVGIISIGDVVSEIISDHEQTIDQLQSYIKGH